MAEATRLPVQHRGHPHCPTCKAGLPNLDGVALMLPPDADSVTLLAVIFHVRCVCGSEWMLKKEASDAT